MTRITAIAASILAFSSTVALGAANGWDWDEEIQYRAWRPASLMWAHDIHPQHPSISYIDNNEAPPPRELWCIDQSAPTMDDCEEHKARLELWAEDFTGTFVPAEELDWPRECPSSCYP